MNFNCELREIGRFMGVNLIGKNMNESTIIGVEQLKLIKEKPTCKVDPYDELVPRNALYVGVANCGARRPRPMSYGMKQVATVAGSMQGLALV